MNSLTADTGGIDDSDGLTSVSYSYQWISNDGNSDSHITDAAGSTYTLVPDDEGNTIKVKVSFTDDAGNEESLTSDATAEVQARPNSPATGVPVISGTVRVDETLAVDTSGISDTDGINNAVFEYQWLADGSEIDGATASSYDLTEDEEGLTIQVRVSFNDDAGSRETMTSAATVAVAPRANTPATGTPTISGTVQVDETLVAGHVGHL